MGKQTCWVQGNRFEIDSRYKPAAGRQLGTGAFAAVCIAEDETTNEQVAIKKVQRPFDDPMDAKRTLREIRLLSHLKHENVVSLRDVIRPESPEMFDDVYLVMEAMDSDLQQVIKSRQELTEEHCQYFLYQILRAVKYLHSAGVVHRDLKPSNLLVNKDAFLRVCDFNLARTTADPGLDDECPGMTQYVVTRWYRAPEVILRGVYTQAIDMWSVGCIFAELINRKPLFNGGGYVHQLELITKVLGTPTEGDLTAMRPSESAVCYLRALPRMPGVPLSSVMSPKASPLALDLLSRMLVYDPRKRISAAEALKHPYLADLHDLDELEEDEPASPSRLNFDFDFERQSLQCPQFKELVYKECLRFHPD